MIRDANGAPLKIPPFTPFFASNNHHIRLNNTKPAVIAYAFAGTGIIYDVFDSRPPSTTPGGTRRRMLVMPKSIRLICTTKPYTPSFSSQRNEKKKKKITTNSRILINRILRKTSDVRTIICYFLLRWLSANHQPRGLSLITPRQMEKENDYYVAVGLCVVFG